MQTYRVCPLMPERFQKDTLPFTVRAANIDGLRKALAGRMSDAKVFSVEHIITGRVIGIFIVRGPGEYVWENEKTAYPVDPATGRIGKRRY